MDSYQTEEEQVESIKKWWADNSRSIIFGVALGLIGLFGWQSWQEKTRTSMLEASDAYQQLVQTMKGSKFDEAILLASEIDETYADTPYAALAGLHKAKAQVETANHTDAVESLEKVAITASNQSIQHIARVRAFKLRIANGDMSGVIADIDTLIDGNESLKSGEFVSQYETLKGDAYRLLGNTEKARYAYVAGLRTATIGQRLIQLKLDNLGPPSASFAGANKTEAVKETEK